MDVGDILPPLPLEPPEDDMSGSHKCIAPPPPPLQTSSDAEEMDVSSGGDGPTNTPEESREAQLLTKGSLTFSCHPSDEPIPGSSCPRTARHAPPVTKFLPDLKSLRDVKISVSFSDSSKSKDRKVLYTGVGQGGDSEASDEVLNGLLHDTVEHMAGQGCPGVSGNGTLGRGTKGDEAEVDLENKVEFAVLDELEDFSENFLEAEDGDQGGFRSDVIAQQEQTNEEDLNYSYEVRVWYQKALNRLKICIDILRYVHFM